METRAHHLLIGGFVVILIGALFAFLIWLAKVDIDREYVESTSILRNLSSAC